MALLKHGCENTESSLAIQVLNAAVLEDLFCTKPQLITTEKTSAVGLAPISQFLADLLQWPVLIKAGDGWSDYGEAATTCCLCPNASVLGGCPRLYIDYIGGLRWNIIDILDC